MLNRLYIVVGVLAILILGAAFIVPGLVPWGDYRGRMEMLASQGLGTPVRINGDIRFVLLPAPHLALSDVSVGPKDQPVMAVKSAAADFSLIDFLRDRYTMTKLVLDHPVLDLTVGKDGSIETPLRLSAADGASSISVGQADIAVGTIRVMDARSSRAYALEGIDGTLTIGALNGPYGFQGGGTIGDTHYALHLTVAALGAGGNTAASFSMRPDNGAFTLDTSGMLTVAAQPHYAGDLSYDRAPTPAAAQQGVGDLTLTGKLDATSNKLSLGGFTLVPDQNRAVTQLGGDAAIDLSGEPSFSATVSGGALALPPRDVTADQGPQPYEIVRLLGDLPPPPLPPLPGTVSATVAQFDLRSFSLRNVKLAAATDGTTWTVKDFSAQLPGNSTLKLAGELAAPEGHPSFAGTVTLASDRLDTLATLWRKPAGEDALFNTPGSFAAKVALSGQNMALTEGQLTLGGATHQLTALVSFSNKRRLDLSAQFGDLSPDDSAALLALLPDVTGDPSAAVTFPQGAVAISAKSATVLGLPGKGLDLEGKWGDGSLEFSKIAADDLGGAGFDFTATASGTLAQPRLAGDGRVTLPQAGGPVLAALYDAAGAPPQVRALLSRALPADLKVHLDSPADDGGQGIAISGQAGAASVALDGKLGTGLLSAFGAPLSANLELTAKSGSDLTKQLGLGDVSLVSETGPAKLDLSVSGAPGADFRTTASLTGGADALSFDGTVTPGDLTAPKGQGSVKVALADSGPLAALVGLDGLSTPPLSATANLSFEGGHTVTLDNVAGTSGDDKFSGKLALASDAKGPVVSGNLTVDSVDATALLGTAAGPTALMQSAGSLWPDGPLSLGDTPRPSTGSVAIETPAVTLAGKPFLTDAGFSLGWNATKVNVDDFEAKLAGGSIRLDAALCCAGPLPDKQLTGQVSVAGVPLSALVPPAMAQNLSGTLDASLGFNGTGDSVSALAGSLSGEGSFTLTDARAQNFDPGVFAAIAGIPDIVDLDAADLSNKVAAALGPGAFAVPKVNGTIALAGGVLRLPNVAAQTPQAKLFGGATLKLSDLTLGGGFSLTPVGTLDKAGIVSETTSKVTADLGGTLLAPTRTLDIDSMVEAVKVKALEVEVARLEALKAADDARQKAAVIDQKLARDDVQAKALADQQAKAAADAAAKAAAAAAKKAAADAAAAAAAKQQPLDLGIPSAPFF